MGDVFRRKSVDSVLKAAENGEKGLHKRLGTIDLIALGVGAIIGTGIFVITGVASADYAGPAVVVSFAIAGLVSSFAALVYTELASMVPVAGSAYTYSYVAFGELIAWIIGWDLVLEYSIAASAVAIGWGGYLDSVLQTVGISLPEAFITSPFEGGIINLPALFVVGLVTLVLVQGVRHSATTNNIAVAIKLTVLALFIAIGLFHVDFTNWQPFNPFGYSGIFGGAAIIFFAYIGFDAVSTAAEEVKDPARDLPRGIIGSLGISTILYIVVSALLTLMVRYTQLGTPDPIATALVKIGVQWAAAVVSIGAVAALTSVLLVDMYGQSRVFYAMARDGLMPKGLAKLHPRFRTPYRITLVTGTFVAVVAAFLPIDVVAQLANIGTLSAFILVSIGVIVLRKRDPDRPRPFRAPWVPYLPAAVVLFSGYLIFSLPPVTWIRFGIWLGIGFLVYFVYGRRHSRLNDQEGVAEREAE